MEPDTGGGFTKNITTVQSADKGIVLKVTAKNENYVAERVNSNGKVDVLATIPDIITIVNLEASMWQLSIPLATVEPLR